MPNVHSELSLERVLILLATTPNGIAITGQQSKHMLLFSNSLNVKALHFPVSTISLLQWVGGRYSLWSAIGLSIALHIGRYSCDVTMPRIALFASGM